MMMDECDTPWTCGDGAQSGGKFQTAMCTKSNQAQLTGQQQLNFRVHYDKELGVWHLMKEAGENRGQPLNENERSLPNKAGEGFETEALESGCNDLSDTSAKTGQSHSYGNSSSVLSNTSESEQHCHQISVRNNEKIKLANQETNRPSVGDSMSEKRISTSSEQLTQNDNECDDKVVDRLRDNGQIIQTPKIHGETTLSDAEDREHHGIKKTMIAGPSRTTTETAKLVSKHGRPSAPDLNKANQQQGRTEEFQIVKLLLSELTSAVEFHYAAEVPTTQVDNEQRIPSQDVQGGTTFTDAKYYSEQHNKIKKTVRVFPAAVTIHGNTSDKSALAGPSSTAGVAKLMTESGRPSASDLTKADQEQGIIEEFQIVKLLLSELTLAVEARHAADEAHRTRLLENEQSIPSQAMQGETTFSDAEDIEHHEIKNTIKEATAVHGGGASDENSFAESPSPFGATGKQGVDGTREIGLILKRDDKDLSNSPMQPEEESKTPYVMGPRYRIQEHDFPFLSAKSSIMSFGAAQQDESKAVPKDEAAQERGRDKEEKNGSDAKGSTNWEHKSDGSEDKERLLAYVDPPPFTPAELVSFHMKKRKQSRVVSDHLVVNDGAYLGPPVASSMWEGDNSRPWTVLADPKVLSLIGSDSSDDDTGRKPGYKGTGVVTLGRKGTSGSKIKNRVVFQSKGSGSKSNSSSSSDDDVHPPYYYSRGKK